MGVHIPVVSESNWRPSERKRKTPRILVAAAVLALSGIAATPTADARPVPALPWKWAGQQTACIKVTDLGHNVCAHLKVSAVKSRQLTAELTPTHWEYGTVLNRQLTILNLNTHQYIWIEKSTCMVTESDSCEMDYYGNGCRKGPYRVDGYLYLTNRNWSLHTRVEVVVR
jgi:hypothetical protein